MFLQERHVDRMDLSLRDGLLLVQCVKRLRLQIAEASGYFGARQIGHGSSMPTDHIQGVSAPLPPLPSGLIDFGDARSGDPLFDLVAVHISVFRLQYLFSKKNTISSYFFKV